MLALGLWGAEMSYAVALRSYRRLRGLWRGYRLSRGFVEAPWRGDFPDVCRACTMYAPLDEKLSQENDARGNWA